MEAGSSQAATALLTEHLQYTPLSLIDDIINSVNNFVYQGVGSLETGLLSTPPERLGFKAVSKDVGQQDSAKSELEYPEAKQEIEEGLHKLETLLNSMVDKNFDKFEIYVLRNILSVPAELVSWVKLSHYENVSFPPPQDGPTAEHVQMLRKKLAASRTVSKALSQEHERNDLLLSQLRTMVTGVEQRAGHPDFAFLKDNANARVLNVGSNDMQRSLTTNTTFVLSQLPALKALVGHLRPQLSALKGTTLGTDSAKDERREERREYIERRTQAHLNRNGQSVAANASVVSGKVVEPDEVQALEKVASIFQSG